MKKLFQNFKFGRSSNRSRNALLFDKRLHNKPVALCLSKPNTPKSIESLSLNTRNEYTDAFQRFQKSMLFERLMDKFKAQPFFERYRILRLIVLLSSYGINIFSVATAFTCVFVFLQTMLQNKLFTGVFSVAFLLGLEAFKRLTIPYFFKNLLQFRKINFIKLTFILCLTVVSVTLSYVGAKDTVRIFTPSVFLTNVDSMRNGYNERITILEVRLEDVRKSHLWKGKLTTEGQIAYNQISNQIAMLEGDKLQNIGKAIAQNDEKALQNSRKTSVNAYFFGLFTLLLDVLLIGLLFFLEYYDYRSFTEFVKLDNQMKSSLHKDEPNDIDNDIDLPEESIATRSYAFESDFIQLAMKQARSNISAYEAKIRNKDGNEETNRRGVEKWQRKYDELQAMSLQP
jgi:hypothetical protein